MKLRYLCFTAFVAFPVSGYAQSVAAPHHHSLSLEAQSVSNGGTTRMSGTGSAKIEKLNNAFGGDPMQTEVSHVKQKRDTTSRTNVQVDIRNFGPTPDSVRLEWYFMAGSVGKGAANARDFIFDHGEQTVSVPAGGNDARIVSSKEARSVQERSATVLGEGASYVGGGDARGSTKESGILIRGWFVRLVDGGQVVAARGSSQTFEDLAKDDTKLNELLARPAPGGKR